MSRRCRVDKCYRDFSVIPSADAVRVIQAGERNMQFLQPLGNAGEVMLEPVSHKDRLAVGSFDDVLQGIQLAVMDVESVAVILSLIHIFNFGSHILPSVFRYIQLYLHIWGVD